MLILPRLLRHVNEQDTELQKQDAQLQELRRQVAAAPPASGVRRLQKGGKTAKTDKANGSGASLGLNAEELELLRDFLESGRNCSCEGATGPAGPPGIAGINGTDGAAGPQGPQGPQGGWWWRAAQAAQTAALMALLQRMP